LIGYLYKLTFPSYLLLAILALAMPTPAIWATQLSGRQIAQNMHDRNQGQDMQTESRMQLISSSGHVRTRKLVTLGKDFGKWRAQVIRFTAPEDIAGTAFLNREKPHSNDTEQFLYLPALKRTRRIVASQQDRRFVNTDFTYEDMQRLAVDNWQHRLKTQTQIGGMPCYVLISTPKPDSDSQYSKVENTVLKKHFVPIATKYWDQKGQLQKKYRVTALQKIQGIMTEMKMQMHNLQSDHKTVLETLNVKYNTGIPDQVFTQHYLETQGQR